MNYFIYNIFQTLKKITIMITPSSGSVYELLRKYHGKGRVKSKDMNHLSDVINLILLILYFINPKVKTILLHPQLEEK